MMRLVPSTGITSDRQRTLLADRPVSVGQFLTQEMRNGFGIGGIQ